MNQSEKQGDKKFKAGKEDLATGIFKWNPDYTSAVTNYSEALKCFETAKCYPKCIDTLKQMALCNEKLLDNWATARNYEQMLDIYIKFIPQTPLETLKQVAHSGFQYFQMAESADKGLQMLGRVAKQLINKGKMQQGIQILHGAYESALNNEKSFKKKEIFQQIVQVYLENNIFQEVERIYKQLIKRQNGVDCAQNGLILLISILLQEEGVRANKQMYQLSNIIPGFLQSDECEAADELIKAFKKGDKDMFLKWTTKPAVTCIFPVIIIKKLREVKISAAKEQPGENEELGDKLF